MKAFAKIFLGCYSEPPHAAHDRSPLDADSIRHALPSIAALLECAAQAAPKGGRQARCYGASIQHKDSWKEAARGFPRYFIAGRPWGQSLFCFSPIVFKGCCFQGPVPSYSQGPPAILLSYVKAWARCNSSSIKG